MAFVSSARVVVGDFNRIAQSSGHIRCMDRSSRSAARVAASESADVNTVLRHRTAHGDDHRPDVTQQAVASVADQDGKDGSASRRTTRGVRINKVLGRIIPIILLVYMVYTYDIVVVRYAYKYLYKIRGKALLPIVWLVPVHAIFLTALRAYLNVFLAYGDVIIDNGEKGGMLSRLRSRLGARLPSPESSSGKCFQDNPASLHVELCQANGEPVRCWRDKCNGKIKQFRTRHCGDCGVCRIGFDHHCAWFDNDVTAPSTLKPFLLFLGCVPPLLGLAVAPLIPSAWMTATKIARFARADPSLSDCWWNRWYSWLGGPVFRWMLGWCLGASKWSRSSSHRMPHHSPQAPVIVVFGAVFVVIASILGYTTLNSLSKGLLTIDVERDKALAKLKRRSAELQTEAKDGKRPSDDPAFERVSQRIRPLGPSVHLRVGRGEPGRYKIVSIADQHTLFDYGGTWRNLSYYLCNSKASNEMRQGWRLPENAVASLAEDMR